MYYLIKLTVPYPRYRYGNYFNLTLLLVIYTYARYLNIITRTVFVYPTEGLYFIHVLRKQKMVEIRKNSQ